MQTFEESGTGQPLVCLFGDNTQALAARIAGGLRLLRIDPAQACDAGALLAATRARGLDTFALAAEGAAAELALEVAAAAPDAVEALVLLSPQAADERGLSRPDASTLATIKAQTLALFGTRDARSPTAFAGHYKRALPVCHLMYVYDAADTARERPEAVSEVVLDFLARRDAFLVNDKDGRAHP